MGGSQCLFVGQYISEGFHLKRNAAGQKKSLLTKLRSAEHHLVSSPAVARLRAVTFLRQ